LPNPQEQNDADRRNDQIAEPSIKLNVQHIGERAPNKRTDDANEEISEAIALWQRCRETDEWPSYPDDVEWIDIPPWKLRERMWQRQSGRGRVRSEADAAAVKMMLDTGNLGG